MALRAMTARRRFAAAIRRTRPAWPEDGPAA
ncbi:hypothetical protein HNR61_005723 [Actinomadura namibiensis]|uniref:Uncharacterized protein n=1 Tax=Actinomadura namibiensis TaxID=182080 RepID=A0A7W3LTN6_ACTNM|nr:hypothetical protein [Actinomadura namibiensis]